MTSHQDQKVTDLAQEVIACVSSTQKRLTTAVERQELSSTEGSQTRLQNTTKALKTFTEAAEKLQTLNTAQRPTVRGARAPSFFTDGSNTSQSGNPPGADASASELHGTSGR